MRAVTAAATAALLSFTAHAATSIPQQYIEVKVTGPSNLEGYQLVAATDFPEFVPADKIGNKPADWYLTHLTLYPGVEFYFIDIVVEGTKRGLTLSGDKNTPGPLGWMPSSSYYGDNTLNYWQPYDPALGSPFDYTSSLQSVGRLSSFACTNSAGRYQLSAYPSGQQPVNCVEVELKWNTSPFCPCPRN
ncbi:hypothetical protein F4803DRAFT_92314 [Xylaria telfairii]|nr:hypothetical protein F4803DRAFT_92314 [Xylaria telfairii]